MFDTFFPEKIADALQLEVAYLPDSQSTQQDARQGRKCGQACPRLYLADHQTAAVGRFGRPFYAQDGQGIYMSLHLPVTNKQLAPTSYTLLLVASMVRAIKKLTGIDCQIKWVNDIYLGQKKIAGILTEALLAPDSGQVSDLLIGVGINFCLTTFPDELKDKAGSLFDQTPTISRQELLIAIWQEFFQTAPDQLLADYKTYSLVLGKTVSFNLQNKLMTGKALDLDEQGQLIVELPNQEIIKLSSGEISLIDWN